jgi:RNA polymerase sigma-70 factor (ECF subfamily)
MSALLSDQQLVTRLQDGDLDALGVLYERYKAPVYRTALAITCDPATAEDILQDSFLRLHKYVDRFDTSRPLKPWLYRITVNLAYTCETRRKRWQSPQDGELEWIQSPEQVSPEWQLEMSDIQSRVIEAISSLCFSQCVVIVLYYLNSFSLKEIAEMLDCPVGTVKSRLYYGRENLYRYLKLGHSLTPEMLGAFS